MGEVYCHTVPNSTLNRDQNPPVEKIVKAISWDPGNAAYWYKLAEGMAHGAKGMEQSAEGQTQSAESRAHGAEGDGYWLLVNRVLEKEGIPDSRITNNE